jgi:tRNA A37 methylthiotransferase MiaB
MNMHVSATVKKTRMSLALHLKSASSMAFKQSMIGKQFPVLWESHDKNEHAIGYTANYIRVNGTGTRNNNVITNEVLQELKDDGTVLC